MSGGTHEHPKFQKMMSDSQQIKFAAIVVYRLDRISRNIGDFSKLIEDLVNREIDFISIREQFDTFSPMGRAMMYIRCGGYWKIYTYSFLLHLDCIASPKR